MTTLRSSLPAFVLSVALLAPHLGKAFTLDDPVFMRTAEHALADPLHPTAFEMVWRNVPERTSELVPTGPVMPWLLVPAALAGGSEAVAHLLQLAMLWLAIVSTVALARRLGVAARWTWAAGVLVVVTPAVLGMAATAMPDVSAMALGAAGIERFVAWSDERRAVRGLTAGVLLALAALTRTHALLLIAVAGVLTLHAALQTKAWRSRLVLAAPLALAVVLLVLVTLVTRDPRSHAEGILDVAMYYSAGSTQRLASNAVAFPIHWVFAMGFAIPWIALRWRSLTRAVSTPLVLLIGGVLSACALAHVQRRSLLLASIAAVGVLAVWDVLADGWKRRDGVQIPLALWMIVSLCALTYVHLPPKYLILSAPAAAILLARELASRTPRIAFVVVAGCIAAGTTLGEAIVCSDAAYGALQRRAVAELIAPRVAAGRRVWFVGHWGFQWYAERAGARHLTLTPPYPEHGDQVVVSLGHGSSPQLLAFVANRFPRMVRTGRVELSDPGGRVMSRPAEAGFYSNATGYLPWSWGNEPVDVFLAFDV
jgi:4-amino-4-deoxy-L-arabinose transferase-like glycosyltransferase